MPDWTYSACRVVHTIRPYVRTGICTHTALVDHEATSIHQRTAIQLHAHLSFWQVAAVGKLICRIVLPARMQVIDLNRLARSDGMMIS